MTSSPSSLPTLLPPISAFAHTPLNFTSSKSWHTHSPPAQNNAISQAFSTHTNPHGNDAMSFAYHRHASELTQSQGQTPLHHPTSMAGLDPPAVRRASDPVGSLSPNTRGMSSEEVLAEKRRRNAGASARFRDRRKQREKELQDKCRVLEDRVRELEDALKQLQPTHAVLDPNHAFQPQISGASSCSSISSQSSHPATTTTSSSSTCTGPAIVKRHNAPSNLDDRVSQLENLMIHFRDEKESDTKRMQELEKENAYLRSLLIPTTTIVSSSVALKAISASASITSDHQSLSPEQPTHKRPRLSLSPVTSQSSSLSN
ncbi:uncharacterized protein BYT42DRAFT_583575 [Radiomyces spectabilis]|uniref:uncharacterized protein n=1 Tax=Radiomyces spectabilis TaxID=64574 RepID=UPI0022210811|nr:uncharacterized protein BYT42DRAFT_583575 [Radiomyces spectabilis]KAI8369222.1 hypothetical protein BYT42DRAFT_583575 [Radiomyces spectabilis]